MVSVIFAVTDLICPKRYISDYTVKKAVWVTGFLKSLYCNPVFLVSCFAICPETGSSSTPYIFAALHAFR